MSRSSYSFSWKCCSPSGRGSYSHPSSPAPAHLNSRSCLLPSELLLSPVLSCSLFSFPTASGLLPDLYVSQSSYSFSWKCCSPSGRGSYSHPSSPAPAHLNSRSCLLPSELLLSPVLSCSLFSFLSLCLKLSCNVFSS